MRSLRLSFETIALYALTSLVAVLSTAQLAFGNRLAVAIITTLAAVAVASTLRGFVRGLGALVLVSIAVGAVRGAVLVTVLSWFGEAERPDLMRVLNSTISAVIWLTAIALAFAGRDDYRQRYAAAVRQVATARAVEGIDALPEVIELKSALGTAVVSTGSAPTQGDLREAAAVLRGEIEDRVRPLSHRIWFSAGSLQPHARIGRLVRDAVFAFTVPIWPVAMVWVLSSFIGAPVIYGSTQGFVSAAACGVLLLMFLLIARRVRSRTRDEWIGAALIVLCSVAPVLGTVCIARALGFVELGSSAMATFLLVPVAIGALLVAGASIVLANADRVQILHIVENRRRAQDPWPSREVSSYLHNSLQSELAGLALQLDRAEPGSPEAQAAVERLAALASRSIADDFRAQRDTPLERLAAGAAAWRGLAAVHLDVDDSVTASDERLPVIVQAVEEITSNAIRHGGARTVRIRVTSDDVHLQIEVLSDGRYAPSAGTGIGERWLASVASMPMSIRPSADGTLVRLVL